MKKKLLSAILCMTMVASVFTGCGKKDSTAETSDKIEIQLLATSDVHGKMLPYDYALDEESTSGSLAQIATLVKELRTENTILIDNGDTIQGNSAELFLEDDIHPMIQGLNMIGYDIWSAGNHEFNYGMDTLNKVAGQFEKNIFMWKCI